MKIKITAIACLLLTSLSFIYLTDSSSESKASLTKKEQINHAYELNQKIFDSGQDISSADVALPDSLEGVEIVTSFKTNDQKQLVTTYAIREMFDTHLSTIGERDLESVLRLMRSEMMRALDEPARSEALSLLKRYVDFKIALAEYRSEIPLSQDGLHISPNALALEQAQLIALRQDYFSPEEYDSFFSKEDAQVAYTIEALKISQNESLTKSEKEQRLAIASQILPDDVRETRENAIKHSELRQSVEELRVAGVNAQQIYELREQHLGSEAALALAELDRDRASWTQKLKEFAHERSMVIDSSLSDTDKTDAIEELLIAHFEHSEQKRARALMNDGRLD